MYSEAMRSTFCFISYTSVFNERFQTVGCHIQIAKKVNATVKPNVLLYVEWRMKHLLCAKQVHKMKRHLFFDAWCGWLVSIKKCS